MKVQVQGPAGRTCQHRTSDQSFTYVAENYLNPSLQNQKLKCFELYRSGFPLLWQPEHFGA